MWKPSLECGIGATTDDLRHDEGTLAAPYAAPHVNTQLRQDADETNMPVITRPSMFSKARGPGGHCSHNQIADERL